MFFLLLWLSANRNNFAKTSKTRSLILFKRKKVDEFFILQMLEGTGAFKPPAEADWLWDFLFERKSKKENRVNIISSSVTDLIQERKATCYSFQV